MKQAQFCIRINPALLAWIRDQAKKDNRSINNWIETELKKIMETTK